MGAPSGPGSRASHEASISVESSRSGIPSAALLEGPRYSPNLRSWLVKHGSNRPWRDFGIYRVEEDGALYIGYAEDDGYFIGASMNSVLCHGQKADIWAYGHLITDLRALPDFWERYQREGRCVIDPEHRRPWQGEETRWLTDGDTRSCLWCCNHTQRLRRWTEAVERERWEPASAIEDESAIGSAETPTTPIPSTDPELNRREG